MMCERPLLEFSKCSHGFRKDKLCQARTLFFSGDDATHEAGGGRCSGARGCVGRSVPCCRVGHETVPQALTAEFKAKVQEDG